MVLNSFQYPTNVMLKCLPAILTLSKTFSEDTFGEFLKKVTYLYERKQQKK